MGLFGGGNSKSEDNSQDNAQEVGVQGGNAVVASQGAVSGGEIGIGANANVSFTEIPAGVFDFGARALETVEKTAEAASQAVSQSGRDVATVASGGRVAQKFDVAKAAVYVGGGLLAVVILKRMKVI